MIALTWRSRPTTWVGRLPSLSLIIVASLLVVAGIQETWVLDRAIDHPGWGMLGQDFSLYTEATRRWLGGGSFYLPWQFTPYDVGWGQILYPPQAIALFLPFLVLGGPLFVLIPTAITVWIIWQQHPKLWAWGVLAALSIVFPLWSLPWVAGTPTVWAIALIALSTRWPWLSAFVLVKPSVFPFALAGVRDRRWWLVVALGAASAVILWPMMVEWMTVVLNSRGENSGLFYSLNPWYQIALVFPIVTWLGRR